MRLLQNHVAPHGRRHGNVDALNANCIACLLSGIFQLSLAQAEFVRNLDKQFQASKAENSPANGVSGNYGLREARAASSDTVASTVSTAHGHS